MPRIIQAPVRSSAPPPRTMVPPFICKPAKSLTGPPTAMIQIGRASCRERVYVLVTGDQDLLAVATNAPLPILDPRGFWNLLSKGT